MTVAAIEAGGTKIVCAVGSSIEEIRTTRMRCVVETTDPSETASKMARFFMTGQAVQNVDRVGIATFGPVDQRTGTIGPTPKPGWSGFSWPAFAAAVFPGAKVTVDTDVNAAALAEANYGASRGLHLSAYLTVGTGIGGGIIIDDHPLQGVEHPEMGHMCVPRAIGDGFPGSCPFHGDCLEGLASGNALRSRAGVSPELLPHNDKAWMLEATYLGTAIFNVMTLLSPERIVVGGGIMKQPLLMGLLREEVATRASGYFGRIHDPSELESFIVAPDLGGDAGIVGAFEMAQRIRG